MRKQAAQLAADCYTKDMERSFWQRQDANQPLFGELLWSRPENRHAAGKLLIIGGNLHGFAAPAEAYAEAMHAGIGAARVLLPDAVRKIIGPVIENGEFAPSTPSGSFSQKALGEALAASAWADGVLMPGDLGRNSETAILIENFLVKSSCGVTLTRDAADYVISTPQSILQRPGSLLVVSLSQLQRLGVSAKFLQPVRFGMDLLQLVDWLHAFTSAHALEIMVQHLGSLFVAAGGRVSTTPSASDQPIWRLKTAAHAAVWRLQHPQKSYGALTAAAFELQRLFGKQ